MVNSLVWSAEEAKYLKAIFRWQETAPSPDEERCRCQAEEDEQQRQQEQKPVGEFRVLVIGGRGTGKTAILTRFGQDTFHGESQPPDPFYERGCRRPITLEITPTPTLLTSPTTTLTTTTTTAPPTAGGRSKSQPTLPKQPPPLPKPKKQTYILDALEMPSPHLLSNPLLAQGLSLTEAAVLVYSVRDAASFRLAQGLAEFMREHFAPIHPSVLPSSQNGVSAVDKGRVYPVVLVGTKSDLPSSDDTDNDDDDATIKREEAGERAVSWAEGAKAAAGMRMPGSGADVPFLEVSAKTGEGVDKVFEVAGQEVLRVRRVVRERRERAQRERMMAEVGSVQTAGGEGRRKRFWLWKVLFGRRGVGGEGDA
ncbi:ras-related and estrogen-regulated growth inhibitor-like protein [Parachaetomium inaequale]|uniref:Ras-related and estrogen-regulated growth inhibitor-like protein n=1 Tax=Parachaetomium inaequale TaxID=2588326 RepID=A0AAN6PBW2_9PEZI|nr:ras-related and estrogen-regulated growth inhibitor-like protein [Parachaetomium inaequale]